MAAPAISNYGGDQETHYLSAVAAGVTIDLPAPGNLAYVIDNIFVSPVAGTMTAFSLEIQKADGTTVQGRAGGTVALLDTIIPGPIVCAKNDAPKIVVASTGATTIAVTVNCHKKN